MGFVFEERSSDSPYVEAITRGRTVGDGSQIRPAECHWHMVFARHNGNVYPFVVGPWTSSGVVSFAEGAEILWVRFELGAFMPHLPTRNLVDMETALPEAASNSFWLNGSAWQFPDFDNVETFIDRLARNEVLARDPLVEAVLRDQPQEMSSRTVRHRFLRATGLTQSHIRQAERARRAEALLQRGVSILDTVHEVGYYDQPHLTRSLRRFTGHTPAQLVRLSAPE